MGWLRDTWEDVADLVKRIFRRKSKEERIVSRKEEILEKEERAFEKKKKFVRREKKIERRLSKDFWELDTLITDIIKDLDELAREHKLDNIGTSNLIHELWEVVSIVRRFGNENARVRLKDFIRLRKSWQEFERLFKEHITTRKIPLPEGLVKDLQKAESDLKDAAHLLIMDRKLLSEEAEEEKEEEGEVREWLGVERFEGLE